MTVKPLSFAFSAFQGVEGEVKREVDLAGGVSEIMDDHIQEYLGVLKLPPEVSVFFLENCYLLSL